MNVGVGLPNPIPGTPGRTLLAWARRAEERGFATLATIDRIVYPSYESLVTLAAVAAVTQHIELFTNVLLGPTRNAVLLAKESASVDQLSGGRLTLGLAVGSRRDDYDAVGVEFERRGRKWDADLDTIHRVWRGEPIDGDQTAIGPTPVRDGRIPILVGGSSDAAFQRVVRWGAGWTLGGAPPERGGPLAERVRAAWKDAGRDGMPRLVALSYFALGEDAEERAGAYLTDYYGEIGERITGFIPKTPRAIRDTIQAFEAYGFHEVILDPTIGELEQLDAAADAAFG
jgi:alkanesulfonate monooxygenase SsuD/methylene tetrahydromethanopterin reductase-like flavin-dependent oxidoreductase (luciferase family)